MWLRDVAFLWNGVVERHIEQYFLIRVESHHVDSAGFEPSEAAMVSAHRWWALGEILRSDEVFAPADLGARLDPLLCGKLPRAPMVVGQ